MRQAGLVVVACTGNRLGIYGCFCLGEDVKMIVEH